MKVILLSTSLFSLACACWLAAMEMTLRQAGYVTRIAVAVSIALISLASLLVCTLAGKIRGGRWLLMAGAIVPLAVGGQAFVRNASAAHFEGFVVVISAALVFQGILMLLSPLALRPDTIQSK